MIKEFIKNCNFNSSSIIFEIGAHMGFDSEIIYELTHSDNFYIFEPDPRNISILKERKIDNIATLVEMAISDVSTDQGIFFLSEGEMPQKTGNSYYDTNDWSASSSIRKPKLHDQIFPWCKITNNINVPYITLDDFCEKNQIKHINFIWMDVQGCEDLVFNGGQRILQTTEYIYTEYSNQELYEGQKTLEEIIKLLPGNWMIRADYSGNVLLENVSYRTSLIKENGTWSDPNTNEHIFDEPLAIGIMNYLKDLGASNCVDFGCGHGKYVEYFNKNNILTEGFDGNLFTPYLTNNTCSVLDLSQPINLNKKYDCVLSLEVGEHIPQLYEAIFIDNIIKHTNGLVIISWAIPDQGGYGHVNCQSNEYIKKIFLDYGFENKQFIENILRLISFNSWFKNTIMVFQKVNK